MDGFGIATLEWSLTQLTYLTSIKFASLDLAAKYKIFPLGDSALTIDFGNIIDEQINKKIIALFEELKQQPLDGMFEAVPAYSSLTLYYDVCAIAKKKPGGLTVYEYMHGIAEEFLTNNVSEEQITPRIIRIPVCYSAELAIDLSKIAKEKNLSTEEFIDIHCAKRYRVYMLGFLPGFAYMGSVDERIAFPRKLQPEKISAGSVGIAGKQTGIYPFDSPGGWQIIGRTPLKMFNAMKEEPCLLKAGDEVEFYSITKDEFENYQSRNS